MGIKYDIVYDKIWIGYICIYYEGGGVYVFFSICVEDIFYNVNVCYVILFFFCLFL